MFETHWVLVEEKHAQQNIHLMKAKYFDSDPFTALCVACFLH